MEKWTMWIVIFSFVTAAVLIVFIVVTVAVSRKKKRELTARKNSSRGHDTIHIPKEVFYYNDGTEYQ